ncbi:hypothetical protein [Streptomyces broussonetiae]|uniref:Uncharacterized protein n=1 Tax=Streptomyces broussonetiae TaxID=2686304 RepID=A0ABV5EKA5_9ACTN
MWSVIEDAAVEQLVTAGFSPVDSRVLTAMVSRRYARERLKLIDVLSGHIGLENVSEISGAVDRLTARGFLTHVPYSGRHLLSVSPDYASHLRNSGLTDAADSLESLMWAPVTRFQSLGPMTEPGTLSSFLQAVSGAQRVIRLPFFSSSAEIEGIEALEQRCRAGVELRILLGSPKTIKEIRGPSHAARARRSIESWTAKTRRWPNTEVRLAQSVEDVEYGSSMSIDGRLLRMDVHEPLAERSLAGEMLLVHETGGNLIRLFDKTFDEIWERSLPVKGFARLRRGVASWRWSIVAATLLAASVTVPDSVWQDLASGAAVTAIFAAFDESHGRLRTVWQRMTNAST